MWVPGVAVGAAAAVWAEIDLPHVGISPEKAPVQQIKVLSGASVFLCDLFSIHISWCLMLKGLAN